MARDILKTQGQISVRFFSSCSSPAALIKYVKTGKSNFNPPPPLALKTINRYKNSLGQIEIILLSERYRPTIFQGKVPSDSAEVDISRAVGKLQTNLYHSILFDVPAVRHQYCPDGPESWCPYKRGVKD